MANLVFPKPKVEGESLFARLLNAVMQDPASAASGAANPVGMPYGLLGNASRAARILRALENTAIIPEGPNAFDFLAQTKAGSSLSLPSLAGRVVQPMGMPEQLMVRAEGTTMMKPARTMLRELIAAVRAMRGY